MLSPSRLFSREIETISIPINVYSGPNEQITFLHDDNIQSILNAIVRAKRNRYRYR